MSRRLSDSFIESIVKTIHNMEYSEELEVLEDKFSLDRQTHIDIRKLLFSKLKLEQKLVIRTFKDSDILHSNGKLLLETLLSQQFNERLELKNNLDEKFKIENIATMTRILKLKKYIQEFNNYEYHGSFF